MNYINPEDVKKAEKVHFGFIGMNPLRHVQPFVIRVENLSDSTIEEVEILHPSKQIDNHGVPKEGIKVTSGICSVTYQQLLYELLTEKIIINKIRVSDDADNPLKLLQCKSDNKFGLIQSRPLFIQDRTLQEIKNIGETDMKFQADVHTGIIIPFVLPKQTLVLYFFPEPPPHAEIQPLKKVNIFKRMWRKIFSQEVEAPPFIE